MARPPARLAGAPEGPGPAPPRNGYITSVPAELGYDQGKLAGLRASGALGQVPAEFAWTSTGRR